MSRHPTTLYQGLNNPALFDPKFNGSQGTNRSQFSPKVNGPDGLPANRDVDAVAVWLDLSTNPHTRRQKRKEIERFMLWCHFERNTNLSSVSVDDVLAYYQFLTDIPDEWVGPRVPRGPDWRPFERRTKPVQVSLADKSKSEQKIKQYLSPDSIRQAKVILGDCFGWLTAVRYLDFNVFDKKLVRGNQNRISLKVERHVPIGLMPWFCQWLDNLPAENKIAIRWRFAVAFLLKTGLREAELASAKMGDVRRKESKDKVQWYIKVTGKGNKVRVVPILQIETLMRYRESMGMHPIPLAGENTPLWIPLRGNENVTPGAIYASLKAMVKAAAKDLDRLAQTETDSATRADLITYVATLKLMSPHWLRHSFATDQTAKGVPLKVVQLAMGHASITTTANYVTMESDQMFDDMEKAEKAASQTSIG